MSAFSEALSVCNRTADFRFCLDNPAFSDCVLVLLVRRSRAPSVSRRLISSVANLWFAAATVTASTVATTLHGTVPASDAMHKLLARYGPEAVGWFNPKPSEELTVARIFQVNSAILAASSSYLRQLIQHSQPLLQQMQQQVPGLTAVAAKHRRQKLVAVVVGEHHLSAAEAIVRFIYTSDIALSSGKEALEALLVAEQLQVPDCAEVCQHYLEGGPHLMDWQVALPLVHLQHKHQQTQRQQQQQTTLSGSSTSRTSSGTAPGGTCVENSSTCSRSSSQLWPGGKGSAAEAIAPPLPAPSESLYLNTLLLRAQDFLVDQFEDLELVLRSNEGRERLLLLPYDALRAILAHPKLKVASENTTVLAAAGWLGANAGQTHSLLLGQNVAANDTAKQAEQAAAGTGVEAACSSAMCTSGIESFAAVPAAADSPAGESEFAADAAAGNGAAGAAAVDCNASWSSRASGDAASSSSSSDEEDDEGDAVAANAVPHESMSVSPALTPRDGTGGLGSDAQQQQQPQQPPAQTPRQNTSSIAGIHCRRQQQQQQQRSQQQQSGMRGVILDLCQVLRLRQCSYTFLVHVLPHLPAFKDEPQLVHQLQFDVLRYQAAGQLRQHRLAVTAAASAGLTEQALADVSAAALSGTGGSSGSGNGGNGIAGETEAALPAGWKSSCLKGHLHARSEILHGLATFAQFQQRPESSCTALDFTFTFDPQQLCSSNSSSSTQGRGWNAVRLLEGAVGAAAASGSNGSSGGAAVSTLLGLTRQQQQSSDHTLLSDDQYFAGYVWTMVVAQDGFAGVAWRVVPPGGQEVAVGPSTAAAAAGAGDVPEVAAVFCIQAGGLSWRQRSSSSSSIGGSWTAATAAAAGGAEAASRIAAAASGDMLSSSSALAGSSSPMKPKAAAKPFGKAYHEVQFIPSNCAWGFPNFPGAGGWDALKGPDGKVTLRCILQHRE